MALTEPPLFFISDWFAIQLKPFGSRCFSDVGVWKEVARRVQTGHLGELPGNWHWCRRRACPTGGSARRLLTEKGRLRAGLHCPGAGVGGGEPFPMPLSRWREPPRPLFSALPLREPQSPYGSNKFDAVCVFCS